MTNGLQSADLHDIEPDVPILPPWWVWTAAVLALAAVVFVVWRVLRKRRQAAEEVFVPCQNAVEEARERLEAVRRLMVAGGIDAFYVAISDTVRHYIEQQFRLRAAEQTTEEFLQEMTQSQRLQPPHKELLADFLTQCDLVKFARFRPGSKEMETALAAATRFVDETVSQGVPLETVPQEITLGTEPADAVAVPSTRPGLRAEALHTEMPKTKRLSLRIDHLPSWVWPTALLVMVAVAFGRCFISNQLLTSTEAPLAMLSRAKATLPDSLIGGWDPINWLGMQTICPATPTWLLLHWMPLESFARLIYVFHIMAVALLSFYWLRRMECCKIAALFGSLVMTFAGSYLTHILPGHIGKFEMTTFALLALLCLTRGLQTARWPDFAGAGVALGLSLQAAIDGGVLMALLVTAWFLFNAGRRWSSADNRTHRVWLMGFLSLASATGLTAFPIVRSQSGSDSVNSIPSVQENDTNESNRPWATQWSFPPAETVDLFAPGYHGWKTRDPKAPYWGVLGRNPQFDPYATPADLLKAANVTDAAQASQLLQSWNFRFNGDFHGTVTLLLILLALVAIFASKAQTPSAEARPDWRAEWMNRHRPAVIFWAAVAAVALLASFGSHFPMPFRLLHSIPLLSCIRHPNALLVVVTPAMAALAAIGMDRLWRETDPLNAKDETRTTGQARVPSGKIKRDEIPTNADDPTKSVTTGSRSPMNRLAKYFLVVWLALAGVALVWLLSLALNAGSRGQLFANSGYDAFVPSNPDTGEKASQIMAFEPIRASIHFCVVTVFAGAIIVSLLRLNSAPRPLVRWGCCGALALILYVEQWPANGSFLDYYSPTQLYADNAILQQIRADTGRPRVTFLTRAGFYNDWLSLLLPYYDIDSIDIPAAPRPAADYMAFFGAVDRMPWRKWELCSVKYILGPKEAGLQGFKQLGYDKFVAVAADFDTPFGKQALFEWKRALPRALVMHRWEVITDPGKQLARLTNPQFDPHTMLVLDADPVIAADRGAPPSSPVEIMEFKPTTVSLGVSLNSPGVLLLNDRFDTGWSATVDDVPATVLRANFIMRGVALSAGDHRVVFTYSAPTRWRLVMHVIWAVIALGLAAAVAGWLAARLNR